ncbi:DUF2269 family protein [Bacillus sp. AFS031507]|uniref:DUF2269 family protein n=1 Tax=Bacillus sp. AFS031507 TaxID=2033496 RepID=UPI000BFE9EC0|nr:DUF2269 family protein [Bacillus sp. AFS031507]PGY09683.1 DUF2269 domain-containing protein [Bacillus sp. AFS031507]
MKKLGPVGMKWLKIIHIILVALFFGGIMSSLALNFGVKLATYDETFETYKRIIIISDQIIRIGAVGTLLVGFLYGMFTNWGFFKHRWVTVKWILFVGQTILGIFIVDKLMMANMAILETEKARALVNPEFIQNQTIRQYAIIIQVAITIFIFCISVFKPWKKKKLVAKHSS